jgi:hypothetical protein
MNLFINSFVQQLRPYIDWNWERSDNDRFTFCDDLDDKIQNVSMFSFSKLSFSKLYVPDYSLQTYWCYE